MLCDALISREQRCVDKQEVSIPLSRLCAEPLTRQDDDKTRHDDTWFTLRPVARYSQDDGQQRHALLLLLVVELLCTE